jgi:sugar/nucleoside kinase (ribokinase family)
MEILVVGHLSRDLIVTPESRRETLGGSPAYAMIAPAIGALGAGIVTKVGADFEPEYRQTLVSAGLDLSGLYCEGPVSTRFVNTYDKDGNRTQRVEAVAPQIRPDDLSENHLASSIVHFSPLTAREIDAQCIEEVRSSGALTSLDVQGYLRELGAGGDVVPRIWNERDRILQLVEVVKFHEDEFKEAYDHESEISGADQVLSLGPRIVLLTRDRRGSTIYTRNAQIDIPLVLGKHEIDPTGLGDTYAISFLLEYMRTADVKRAGLFAATCSSFVVEATGPVRLPSRERVEERISHYL